MSGWLLVAVMFSGSGVADAQDLFGNTDPRPAVITRQVGAEQIAQSRRVMLGFAQCVQKLYPQYVRRFLDTEPGSAEETKAGNQLATTECVSGGMLRFNISIMRGSFYEAALAAFHSPLASLSDDQIRAAPPIDYRPAARRDDPSAWSERTSMLQFTDCTIRSDPASARALLRAVPGSEDEIADFAALNPALGACLPEKEKIGFTKIVLRNYLAEAMYRLSYSIPKTLAAKN